MAGGANYVLDKGYPVLSTYNGSSTNGVTPFRVVKFSSAKIDLQTTAGGQSIGVILFFVTKSWAADKEIVALLSRMGETGKTVFHFFEVCSKVLFGMVNLVMKVAPIGAFGAMAFTIGKYGIGSLQQLAQLLQSQTGEIKKMTFKMTFIGQGVLLLNLFYVGGVLMRAYENLFGPKKS